jgi:hypothetical protein
MTQTTKKKKPSSNQSIRRWHRYVGYTACFFVIILSLTGLILNRTIELELNEKYVKNDLLIARYGLGPKGDPIHFKVNEGHISWLGGKIFLNQAEFAKFKKPLLGVISLKEYYIFTASNEILITLKDGQTLEVITSFPFSANITAIGVSSDKSLKIRTSKNTYSIDDDFTSWEASSSENIIWSKPLSNTTNLNDAVKDAYLEEGLSLYKVILDLHSGRIFGTYGGYIMDISAIALIFLSISGLFNRKKSKRKFNGHAKNKNSANGNITN